MSKCSQIISSTITTHTLAHTRPFHIYVQTIALLIRLTLFIQLSCVFVYVADGKTDDGDDASAGIDGVWRLGSRYWQGRRTHYTYVTHIKNEMCESGMESHLYIKLEHVLLY